MAFTYIDSGKKLIGEKVEGFMASSISIRLCSAAPVSTASLNELSGRGYSERERVAFVYNSDIEIMENEEQLVFGPATRDWATITHILLTSLHREDGSYLGRQSGVFFELSSSITVQSGDSLIFEPGSIKLGLSRVYDGSGAAANFILPAEANALFSGSNFVNAVIGGAGPSSGPGGIEVHLKLLTGEPTLTDSKETVPDFPGGVEILLGRAGSTSAAYFTNQGDALYGPFASGATFTHFAIGYSDTLGRTVGPRESRRVTPGTHEAEFFNIYGYDTLSSPIVVPPNQSLFIPKDTILTSRTALT